MTGNHLVIDGPFTESKEMAPAGWLPAAVAASGPDRSSPGPRDPPGSAAAGC